METDIKIKECYLLKLPSEVLETIIHLSSVIVESEDEDYQFLSWTYPEHSYSHLKSIALCCRRLYRLCAPFLWKDKEFILPREDDQKTDSEVIQMATDILSKKALFQEDHYLGDYVRSLSRDLTSGPHFDLANSRWMAQLVRHLRALRIDFHAMDRTEHYGLCYFLEYCPHLTELYLNQCRDTFDDFLWLVHHRPRLQSLTLTNCTIKQSTLEQLSSSLKPSLQHLLFKQVLIEPDQRTKSNAHLMNPSQQAFIHPFHFQDTQVTVIPPHLFRPLLLQNTQLTQLALTTDSISSSLLQEILQDSPRLEKLAIMLHDLNPYRLQQTLIAVCQLDQLKILSVSFKICYPVTKESDKLPCHVPANTWHHLAHHLSPQLELLHLSATRIIVDAHFIPTLLTRSHLKHIMIHNLALVTVSHGDVHGQQEAEVVQNYLDDCESMTDQIEAWQDREYLFTYEQAKRKGFDYFDEATDQVCFIKGFLPVSFSN